VNGTTKTLLSLVIAAGETPGLRKSGRFGKRSVRNTPTEGFNPYLFGGYRAL